MSAKEKATDLVLKFLRYSADWQKAKQCAIVSVTEMINEMMDISDIHPNPDFDAGVEYWHEVREEIFKM